MTSNTNKTALRQALVLALALAIVPLSSCSCTMVEPGHVGIVVDKSSTRKQITAEDLRVGRVWFNPYSTDVVVYPVRVVRVVWTKAVTEGPPVDESFSFNTNEGVSLNADVALSFHLQEESAAKVYTKFRATLDVLKDGFIRDVVRDALARAASARSVDEIMGEGRAAFASDAQKHLEEKLTTEGFVVDNFSLINDIRVPASIKQRIDEKIATTQEAIAAENKLRKTKAEAQQNIEEARGRAEALKLRAQGEADANAILAKSITPDLARFRLTEAWIAKWDGHTPMVAGDGSTPMPMLNLPPPQK